jgi:hypothetical protein
MADLYHEVLHWSLGVITSAEPDEVELKHAFVRGDNMQFTKIAAGRARPRRRGALTLVNQTPFSNTSDSAGPAIAAGALYPYLTGGSKIHYNIVVLENGDVHLVLDDGSSTDLAPTASFVGSLTTDLELPDFAVMNNRMFIQDGLGGRMSIKGTSEVNWGVSPVTGLAATVGAAGGMTGDYDVKVTAWDDTIGAESDLTAKASVTLTADKLTVTVDSVAVGLTNMHFRVYVQKATLGAGYYRVSTGTGYVGGSVDGYPLFSASPTVSTTIDISDADFTALVIKAPTEGANGVPDAESKFVAVYQRRLFIADTEGVWWSELDSPDNFNVNSYEPIKSRDPRGGDITAMKVHGGVLHIFTETARITLTGETDVAGWQWDTADPDMGCVGVRAVSTYAGRMFWWDREHGPVLMDGDGNVTQIGNEFIGENISTADAVAGSSLHLTAVAGGDMRVLFAIPELGKTRLTKQLSFHSEMNRWESTRWDPMDGCIFAGMTSSKEPTLYLGNYNGQLFRMLKGDNDGVRTGTASGTFTASGTSVTTITDGDASFDVSGAGLIERKVTVLDSAGAPVTSEDRPYIISNTETEITLNTAVTGLTSGETYTYIIGGPDFVLETFWDHMGMPFIRKRMDRLFLSFRSTNGAARVHVGIAVSTQNDNARELDIADSSGSLWDDVNWDEFFWNSAADVNYSLPVIKSGLNYRVQIRNPYPDQGITLLKLGMLGKQRGDRYRRGT